MEYIWAYTATNLLNFPAIKVIHTSKQSEIFQKQLLDIYMLHVVGTKTYEVGVATGVHFGLGMPKEARQAQAKFPNCF
jgi:hypothetical protein